MRFHRIKNPLIYNYSINDTLLTNVTEVNDLGVYFDQKLILNNRFEITSNKVLEMFGFVIKYSHYK